MKNEIEYKLRDILTDIISALFVLLFLYAAISKLKDYEKFQIQLGKSPILSTFAFFFAGLVPALEIGIAMLLMIKRLQLLALYAAFSLMVIFSVYIVFILNFGEYIPCSCGGVLANFSWTQHFWFNIAFVILGVIGVLIYPYQNKVFTAR